MGMVYHRIFLGPWITDLIFRLQAAPLPEYYFSCVGRNDGCLSVTYTRPRKNCQKIVGGAGGALQPGDDSSPRHQSLDLSVDPCAGMAGFCRAGGGSPVF